MQKRGKFYTFWHHFKNRAKVTIYFLSRNSLISQTLIALTRSGKADSQARSWGKYLQAADFHYERGVVISLWGYFQKQQRWLKVLIRTCIANKFQVFFFLFHSPSFSSPFSLSMAAREKKLLVAFRKRLHWAENVLIFSSKFAPYEVDFSESPLKIICYFPKNKLYISFRKKSVLQQLRVSERPWQSCKIRAF